MMVENLVNHRKFARFAKSLVALGLLLLAAPVRAEMVRSGYIQDVQAEKAERYYEVYLASPAVNTNTTDIRGKIFNPQLTNEFRARYVERFGYIDNSSLNFAAERFNKLPEESGPYSDIRRQNEERKLYAEYVLKRLAEWHTDNYFKSDPKLQPLYEAKERLSNVQVAVNENTYVKATYGLADNSAEITVVNPYVDSKVRVEMNPKTFGPSEIIENWIYIGRRITRTLYMLGTYAQKDGWAQVEIQKQHSPNLSTSYMTSTTTTAVGRSPRQTFFGYALYYFF